MSLYTHSAFVRGRGLSQLKSRLKYIKHRLYKGLKPEMTKFSIKFLGQNQRKPQCLCGLSGFGVIITPASTRLTIPVAFIVYLSPFTIHLTGGHRPPLRILSNIFVGANCVRPPYNNFTNYAVSICKRTEIIPQDLLFQIAMI